MLHSLTCYIGNWIENGERGRRLREVVETSKMRARMGGKAKVKIMQERSSSRIRCLDARWLDGGAQHGEGQLFCNNLSIIRS